MSREERTLDLKKEDWLKLDQIYRALGHDEIEETVSILIALGFAAVSVSDKQNRKVKVLGTERKKGEKCEKCGNLKGVYSKESSVILGREENKSVSTISEEG